MNLAEHYNNLYNNAIKTIENDNYQTDSLIDDKTDHRFGITLLLRPSEEIKNNIETVLNDFKDTEPNQYYYPTPDIHVTIMSIISCYNGFDLNKINVNNYIKVIEKSIKNIPKFRLEFNGLTASPSCVMLQGFMSNSALNDIRDNLRTHFKATTVEQSIDKRYAIQTAHSTVLRFKNKFVDKTAFITKLNHYKNHNFGSCQPQTLELVYNDWYQRQKFVKTLATFNI